VQFLARRRDCGIQLLFWKAGSAGKGKEGAHALFAMPERAH
jgi:hypothetical protein